MQAQSAGAFDALVDVHALAELWSVLTKLPVVPPVSPVAAREAVASVMTAFEVVPLTLDIYDDAIDRCASKGLRSGAIFDALHLVAAERASAEALLTFNDSDFNRLTVGSPGDPRIIVPPDPPAVLL